MTAAPATTANPIPINHGAGTDAPEFMSGNIQRTRLHCRNSCEHRLEFRPARFMRHRKIDLCLTKTLPLLSLLRQPYLLPEHLTCSKYTGELRIAAYLPKAPSSCTQSRNSAAA